MIIEYSKDGIQKTNNTLADQIANAEYYLLVAKLYGSKSSVYKWKRKLKELKQKQDNG